MTESDDEYSRRYMEGGEARFTDKVRAPAWVSALLLGGGAAGVVTSAVVGAPLFVPFVAAGVTLGIWGLFSTIRVVVTRTHTHVQLGVFGPKIPLSQIESATVVKYNPLNYGGWGLRFGLNGSRAYSLPGHSGKAVRIVYREGNKERVVEVTSEHPDAVCRAIEESRTRDLASAREAQGVATPPPIERDAALQVAQEHEALPRE